jgi:tetratricopeptide (TPR) repeat protein
VSVGLQKIGGVKLQQGDVTGALAANQESLAIARKLAAEDSGNAQAQRDLSVSLVKLGNLELKKSDMAGALAAYQESLGIVRKLAAQDPTDVQAQTDLESSLYNMSFVADHTQAKSLLTEALSIIKKLEQEHKLTTEQKDWPDMVRTALSKLH